MAGPVRQRGKSWSIQQEHARASGQRLAWRQSPSTVARRRTINMASKMLIDAAHPEETRVVAVKGNRVEEFDYESANKKQLRGNIYLAKVTRVEPSLQAAFVDYGGNRHGFLAFTEIHPDYYQIPVADRQALLEEEAQEEIRASAAEAAEDDAAAGRRRRRGRRGRGRQRARAAEIEQPNAPRRRQDPTAAKIRGRRRNRSTKLRSETETVVPRGEQSRPTKCRSAPSRAGRQ